MASEAQPPPAPARPTRARRVSDFVGALVIAISAVGSVVVCYWYVKHAVAIQRLTRGVGDTLFLSADGKPWFRLDEHRYDVPLAEISPHLRHAVIAIEDRRFYRHPGIDPLALGRAVVRNARALRVVEGGSTLTQQLARTLFLTNRRNVGRKAKEAVLALMLEQALSKDQILELYLNRVALTGEVRGVGAMSRELFLKNPRQLSPAEAALIAGVIRAPSALSPWSNRDAAVARSSLVLRKMREQNYLTAQEEQQALQGTLRLSARPARGGSGGYAKEYLRQLFRELASDDDPPDWRVRTTFVPALQQAAEQALARGLAALRRSELQGALVALDAHTGDVLAMVGGTDFGATQFNRALRSRRQPGSAFKPFVYAAALEKGLSPVSLLRDLQRMQPVGRDEWEPHNASAYEDPDVVTLREALVTSNNRAAVALQQQLGTRTVLEVAGRVGLHDLPDVPSLALGTGLVTPLELTAAFAVFPNGGWALKPRAILEIREGDNDVAYADASMKERVLSTGAAFQALSMLRDVAERGTGQAARSLGFPVAGKTGTTDDFKDAWFVGFSADTAAGVWVGFDQPAPIASNGYAARVALPIWIDFMQRAARLRPPREFEVPEGLREIDFCRITYRRASAECPAYVEYFKPGDEVPEGSCPLHRGALRQRVGRTIGGLWEKIRGIFR
jgi:penicillin-binding protein 1A